MSAPGAFPPAPSWPAHAGEVLRSRRGRPFLLRRGGAGDAGELAGFYQRLSAGTIYLRYFMARPAFSPDAAAGEAARALRGGAHTALLAVAAEGRVVGLAELSAHADATAEVAVVVADAYQGEGIGLALCAQVGELARAAGASAVIATVLPENRGVMRLVGRLGLSAHTSYRDGMTHLRIPLS